MDESHPGRAMTRRKSLAVRDQAVSEFSGALMRLCDATAALGAALVDAEGETVDYAGRLEPFEIRVAAAEWRLVLQCVNEGDFLKGVASVLFRGRHKSFAIYGIADGYALVVQLAKNSLIPSARAVAEAARNLATEAGLTLASNSEFRLERWHRVEVKFDGDRRRPTDLWHEGRWLPLEVLGRYADDDRGLHCVGFRARIRDGSEMTLIREPLNAWYIDELPNSAAAPIVAGS